MNSSSYSENTMSLVSVPSLTLTTMRSQDANAFAPETVTKYIDEAEQDGLYLALEEEELVRLDNEANEESEESGDSYTFPILGAKLRGLQNGKSMVFAAVDTPPGYGYLCTLTLSNPSLHDLAFKVAGNRSRFFRSVPNQGVLSSGHDVPLKIYLKNDAALPDTTNPNENLGGGDSAANNSKSKSVVDLATAFKVRVKLACMEKGEQFGSVWSRSDVFFELSPRFSCQIWNSLQQQEDDGTKATRLQTVEEEVEEEEEEEDQEQEQEDWDEECDGDEEEGEYEEEEEEEEPDGYYAEREDDYSPRATRKLKFRQRISQTFRRLLKSNI